jgi:hypothetical protein
MGVLFANQYVRVEIETAATLIRYVRSADPYATLDEVERTHEEISRILDRVGRERHGFLMDMRLIAGNQSPDFEKVMGRVRRVLLRGFPRIAAVVRTAAGVLQLQRHAREDGVSMYVFRDEETALVFLRPPGAFEGDLRDTGPKSAPASGGPRSSRLNTPRSSQFPPPRSSRQPPTTIPPGSSRHPSLPPGSSRHPSIPPGSSRHPPSIPPPGSVRHPPTTNPPGSARHPPSIPPGSTRQPPSTRFRR